MRTNYSKIATKIKPEVAEEEAHNNTQIVSGRGDKSSLSVNNEGSSSPNKKSPSPRKGRAKQVHVDESQLMNDGDEEVIASGKYDRQYIIY